MRLRVGDIVCHKEVGPGRVIDVLGGQVIVDCFGERLHLAADDLELVQSADNPVEVTPEPRTRIRFRRAYEAINLGVVPPHPDELLALSIGGEDTAKIVSEWLEAAPSRGFCKVVFGDYGTGKSHYLRLVQAAALRKGWVVSYVEFDPKQADPAKPHLAYRAIVSNLKFPRREDGIRTTSFCGFVKEVRGHWPDVSDSPHLSDSVWFSRALEALCRVPHSDEPEYQDAVNWLAGQPVNHAVIRTLCRSLGGRLEVPPTMPKTLNTAEIYVHHLVVLNDLFRRTGYQGLLVILDEAEHVRGFSVNRRNRANNFFDILSRSAHRPIVGAEPPLLNEHGYRLPRYWRAGPHFGLVVGLTEGNTFADPDVPLRDACVFLHHENDRIRLKAPSQAAYRSWCIEVLRQFSEHYPAEGLSLSAEGVCAQLADTLAEEYEAQPEAQRTLRLWTKLASYVVSLLLAGFRGTTDELVVAVRKAAQEASGRVLPWET